jgi:hypothetical protein
LVYIKTIYEDLYSKINSKALTIEELQKDFFEIIKGKVNEDNERKILQLEVYLVNAYNNYKNDPYSRNKIYQYDNSTNKNKLLIKSVIDKTENGDDFLNMLENMNRYESIEGVSIEHLLKKINLTEVFK